MDLKLIARDRAHQYMLFGALFLKGITVDFLPAIRSRPSLAACLTEPIDADEAAAEHYGLFGQSVLPHATLFLDEAGLLGGPVSNAARLAYGRTDYEIWEEFSPDHLGQMMLFLSHICFEEGEINRPFMPDLQRDFLQMQLLPWLPVFQVALQMEDVPFYHQVSKECLELVVAHFGALGGKATETLPLATPPALDLTEAKTGLKQIAAFLTTPPQCGFYLSRRVIERLARLVSLPRGFGKRSELLHNLFRTAAQYEAVGTVVGALTAVCEQWQSAYQTLAEEQPTLAPFLSPWQRRLQQTQALLSQIEASQSS